MSTLTQREVDARERRQTEPARVLQLIPPSAEVVEPQSEVHDHDSPALAAVLELEQRERNYRRWLGIADGVASVAVALLAILISGDSASWLAVFIAPFAILIAKIQGLYDRDDQVIQKTNVSEWRRVLQSAVMTSTGVYLAWRVLAHVNRGGGMRLFVALVLGTCLAAVVLRSIARRIAGHVSAHERCVIVAGPSEARGLISRLQAAERIDLVGMVREDALTGSVSELRSVVEQLHFHRLVIVPSDDRAASTLHLIQAAKFIGIRVTLVPSVMAAVGGFAEIEELDGLTLLGVPRFGLSRSSVALKRCFDLVVGTLALILLSPVLLAIALAIKLDSRGPVVFKQTRIGRGGKPFKILKFRSMVDGADALKADLLRLNEAGAGLFKIADDPRITRVGKFIRSTHLDELTQLINVLKGEMSLVGPRPLVVEEDARVTGRDRHRLNLTPGITGPWQIKGPMNTPLSEMAMLDYRYASDWSIWTDLDILIQTVFHVLGRGGH